MSDAIYVFDAFPHFAYSGQIDLDELKNLVLEEYGYHCQIWGTRDTRPQDLRGRYKKVTGGTAMKPARAVKNLREDVAEDPGDLTIFDDGSWSFEVDERHPIKDPVGHWDRDLTPGQKVVSLAGGAAVFIGIIAVLGAILGD